LERRSYSYNSPYAGPPRRASSWPWIAGVVIVVCFLAAAGLLAQAGLSSADQSALSQLTRNQSNVPGSASPASIEPTETPQPTETPAPTPTHIDTGAPRATAETWLQLWHDANYAGMYGLLSTSSQSIISQQDFVTRYTDIVREAGVKSVTGEVTGDAESDGTVPIKVTLESSLLNKIEQEMDLPVIQEDSDWLVNWSPSLIFRQLGETGCIDYRADLPLRGRILDRNGKILAEDADVSRIGIVPGDLVDPAETMRVLSSVVGIPAADIQTKLDREGIDPGWFVPIKDIPGEPSVELLNKLTMPGVQVRRATARNYPYGPIAAHITGWVTPATEEDVLGDPTGRTQPDELIGRAGLEFGANDLLSGQPGGKLLVVDCDSRAERETITESTGTPAQDLYLTIDINLQTEVDKEMSALQGEERGAAVILNPQTGEVLALVSHPSFDPNDALTNSFDEKELARIDDPVLRPMANRATFERYPTGSIFKVITTAAAMKYLGYTGDTPIDCPASFTIGDSTWNDWVVENGLSAQGQLTLHTGLVQSCNTVFYQIGAALDYQNPEDLPDMAKAFGLGAKTGIPYFPEIAGTVPDPEWKLENLNDGWATGDAVNLSIGQGFVEATPLQMANVYAAIANGGTLLQPYIVDRSQVQGSRDIVQVGERKVIREIPLDKTQMAELQSALRDQTSNDRGVGSAKVFGDFDWPISGKTGTAQNGTDWSEKPHSWFAAYGPSDKGDKPTIASCIMIENVGEGVTYAAPITKNVYEWYINSDLAGAKPTQEATESP
jgi:penicillin-binding protein 2